MDILVTRRLTLRPPLEVDADAIFHGINNPKVGRMLTRVPSPYTLKDTKDWIAKSTADANSLIFTIHRQNLLGVVSLEDNGEDVPDLGYWLVEPHWGQGIMTEAARALLSHAFRKLDCDAIQSGAYEDNYGSQKVLDKLGFEPTGTAKHHCLTRGVDVTCNRVSLSRRKFEQMFGSLETDQAA